MPRHLALSLLFGALLTSCCGLGASDKPDPAGSSTKQATTDDRDTVPESPRPTSPRPTATTPPAPQTPVDRATAKADKAWAQFDKLRGDQFRTLAMLQAHRLQADQGLDFLPDSEAKVVREHNAREFRKRVPALLVPGESGSADGDANEVVIPSSDPSRCAVLAKGWQKGDQGQMLAGAGFKKIRCGAQEWPLPPK